MQVTITPGVAKGTVAAPSSKSMAHRYLICAAMSEGQSTVRGISACEDVSATLDCLHALGVEYTQQEDAVLLSGKNMRGADPQDSLCCRESGSTLRFMIPIALLSGREVTLCGAPSLMKRPMDIYEALCREKAMLFSKQDCEIKVRGPLPAGDYVLPGNVSSQFITGLLFALPLLEGNSRICVQPPFASRSYIDMTLSALRDFGIAYQWDNEFTLCIPGNQRYCSRTCEVEGDYSNAAFLEALNYFGSDVTVIGLREDSLQGDRVYRQCFAELNAGRATIDLTNCPDLGPILFSFAAAKHGGVFTGTKRLRIKESDRVAVMVRELEKFGTRMTVSEDTVIVDPVDFHAPACLLEGHNDHRIVMSMAVLCTLTGGTIDGAEAVQKSYPAFFKTLNTLGVNAC